VAGRLEAVRLQGLALMAEPKGGAKMLRALRAGQTVTVESRDGVWVEVLLDDGTRGFVNGGFLTGFPDIPPLTAYASRIDPGVVRPAQPARPGPEAAVTGSPRHPETAAAGTPAIPDKPSGPVTPSAEAPKGAPSPTGPLPRPVDAAPPPVRSVGPETASIAPPRRPDTAVAATPATPGEPAGPVTVAPGRTMYEPVADGGGLDGFLSDLVRPRRSRADRTAAERLVGHKSRYFIEVHLSERKLYLYENMPDGTRRLVHSYVVAVPGRDMEAPQGWGVVTGISFEPWWYPTASMKARAKKKGKSLPNFVRPGVKANPMGAFKIILSHGDGFRIHGNNNPGSIGRPVTSGCIRMRNDEGKDMARMIDVGTEVVFSQ
jgi:lipoprotein-anchoring transpeptidase ErfK/SrfK